MLIDLIFTFSLEKGIWSPFCSDHCPVYSLLRPRMYQSKCYKAKLHHNKKLDSILNTEHERKSWWHALKQYLKQTASNYNFPAIEKRWKCI